MSSSKRSLRLRAIAWFFVPTVVILIAVGLVNFYSYQDVTEELVLERGQELPRVSASRLSSDLQGLTKFVSDVARDVEINRDPSTTRQDVLDRAGRQSQIFDGGVLILNTFGKVVATGPSHAERMGQDWSDRSYFRQIVRDQSVGYHSSDPIFTNIIDDGSRQTGAIAVAVPIITDQGLFTGSVVGVFSLLSAHDFYARIVKLLIGGSGNTYLVDGNGRVIYHSDTRHIAADFSAQPAVERISERQAGNIRTRDIDGEDIVASFAPVPGTTWGLVTEESWSSLIGASQGYQRFLLVLLVLGVAVPAVFAAIGLKRVMRPVADLTVAVKEVAKGNFGQRITARSGDEIGELATAFNSMATQLQGSYAALNEELERRRQTEAQLLQRSEELESLFTISSILGQPGTYEDKLNGVMQELARVAEADWAALRVPDPQEGGLRTSIRVGRFEDSLPHVQPGGVALEAFETGQTVVANDYQTRPDASPSILEQGAKSVISLPLKGTEETLAVASVVSRKADHFNPERVRLLTAIVDGFGVLLESATLYQDLVDSNRQLSDALDALKATQQRVAQQERLNALGTMASGIAHDFNNALSPILGYSAFLLEDADQYDETTLDYLRVISTSAQDAAAVVRRLRDFYRQREGSELMMAVDINDVVARVISLTQPRWRDMAQAKGIDIQLSTQLTDGLPEVSGDEAELRTALGNVIFNASDAMPDGGTITLRSYQDGEEIVLEVTDTGTGMTDEVLRRAMEPFFTTKEEQGTGLGLAMVYGTLQRHDGKLEVQSEVGQGTTVRFRLPIQTADQEIPLMLEAEPLPAGLRFLVVDDELRVRDMVGDFLLREGSTVETAINGLDALEKFQRDKFDLVITDRGMPEMNGDALATAIKELAPNMPIIMLTGFGEMMITAGERPPGVDRLLGKPVTPAALRQAVTALRAEYAAVD